MRKHLNVKGFYKNRCLKFFGNRRTQEYLQSILRDYLKMIKNFNKKPLSQQQLIKIQRLIQRIQKVKLKKIVKVGALLVNCLVKKSNIKMGLRIKESPNEISNE